jgi:HTH-type transcriptional regulator, competence development regulator
MSESVVTLGEELRRIRELHKLTLRAVEGLTGISNAYLSQLETGKIEKPSPNYLYKLAEIYSIPYDLLMEKAGYIVRQPQGEPKKRSLTGAALSTLDNLTPEEAEKLAEYLAFLRSQGKSDRL